MSEALDEVAADSSQASSYRRLFGVTLRAQPTNSAVPIHPVVCVGLACQAGDLAGFCTRKLRQDVPVILSISDDFESDFCFCHAPLCGRFEFKQRPSKAPNHSSRTSLAALITKSSGSSGPNYRANDVPCLQGKRRRDATTAEAGAFDEVSARWACVEDHQTQGNGKSGLPGFLFERRSIRA